MRVGINPGIPALPPEQGPLSGDPVRFGVSDILSFSPLGTATPGTFYLAGDSGQAAVRVTGGSARVRLMVWRGGAGGRDRGPLMQIERPYHLHREAACGPPSTSTTRLSPAP